MKKNSILHSENMKLERNKNSYFVNLSHELRTPLNVISSTNQLIQELDLKLNGKKRKQYSSDDYLSNCWSFLP